VRPFGVNSTTLTVKTNQQVSCVIFDLFICQQWKIILDMPHTAMSTHKVVFICFLTRRLLIDMSVTFIPQTMYNLKIHYLLLAWIVYMNYAFKYCLCAVFVWLSKATLSASLLFSCICRLCTFSHVNTLVGRLPVLVEISQAISKN